MRVRSRHNSKQRRIFRVVGISIAVILFGMIMPRLISTTVSVVMTPVHGFNQWFENSSSLVPSFFRDRRALQNQINDLEHQLTLSERSTLTQVRLAQENDRLRKLLGADEEERVVAAITARPSELPYDLLQIDRGADHGIEIGAPVFIGKDMVIGLIVHVTPKYSFAELITTPGFSASAFIAGANVVVSMEGMGGGVARVRVPQGVPLSVGDLVYLPSVEPGVFGSIAHLENLPTQPEQYGYISPDTSLSSIYWVSVGKQSQLARSPAEIDERVRAIVEQSLSFNSEEISIITATTTATSSEEIMTE